MKVLLPIDGSPESDAAVVEVASRPWPEGTTIKVVSVAENIPMGLIGLPAAYFQNLTRPLEEHARAVVDAATSNLIRTFGDTVDVYGEVQKGSSKRLIIEEANRWGADLIVVGSHGHGALERFWLGSLTLFLVLHAPCSVEVVRNRSART